MKAVQKISRQISSRKISLDNQNNIISRVWGFFLGNVLNANRNFSICGVQKRFPTLS